ncbi:MAG TPA: acetate uptake transporter [Bacillota bacterium]|nr:acetate uptake transporter [Peptococcaceae bacterium MAG4]NLW38333.1 acetate uptake transporter [Peptococcaceae bacterium]HPZ42996.1 acetate uptake transporter [Bacillota bacterium]HQD75384.1 acetate uptake transporter [Bacillota bacterium]HUM58113.1 acetate uptake transporter [Bacillota bacterium]
MSEEKVYVLKENGIADPSTVGLASFGIALFCLSFVNAGLVGAGSIGLIIAIALICGGMVHTIVALWGFLKNELFTALVFGTYGAFWTIFSLFQLGLVLEWFEVDPSMMTVFFIAWTIFTFIIWIATLVTNTAVIVIITTLLIVFILLVLGLAQLAGYVGIFTALAALYTAAAGILNTMYGRQVLPVGGPLIKLN